MNHLYYGDNLDVMRKHIADASVDLVYLDPPFNSNADYNAMFKTPKGGQSPAQMTAFTDTWQWDDAISGQAVSDVKRSQFQDAAKMLDAMIGFLGKNALTAYLAMMAVRLVELHRVLKPTGSLYLHCDPVASHYLKLLLDAVFGAKAFQNEIVWRRTSSHNSAKRWGPVHDTIFFYSKITPARWFGAFETYDEKYLDRFYRFSDDKGRFRVGDLTGAGVRKGDSGRPWRDYDPTTSGRHWAIPTGSIKRAGINGDFDTLSPQGKLDRLDAIGLIYWPPKGKVPQFKRYLENERGTPVQDVISDIGPLSSQAQERLGYPTQKPVALLERILAASSGEGDVVLDPFCGCGTTVHAAQKMNRQWIGIDITHLAVGLIENRILDAFPDAQFKVHGTPMDVDAARDFFDRDDKTKKEFEKWAVTRLHFVPQDKKGADGGIDGVKWFGVNEEFKAVVSVKGGMKLGVEMVRSLDAVVTAQGAQVGVLLLLEPPTKPMLDWARQAGMCEVDGFAPVPRIQIVTIGEAMERRDRAVDLPARRTDTFKKAAREEDASRQKNMDL